jgi:RNA polymerase sigma-70 factor (ECF subfamily)
MMFSQHLEDEISADLCAQMERHLEGCGRCRGTCETLKRTLALCRTNGDSVAVPAAVQASVKTALRGFLAENG